MTQNELNEEKEVEQYRLLTVHQKNIVDALKNMGFQWKYFHTYQNIGFSDINVSNFSNLSSVLKWFHEDGKLQKAYELQRCINL